MLDRSFMPTTAWVTMMAAPAGAFAQAPAAAQVGHKDVLDAVRYFEQANGANVLSILVNWNPENPASSTREVLWAQYDEAGKGILRTADTRVETRVSGWFGEAVSYASDGKRIEVVAYTVWEHDTEGNLTGGTVMANGSAIGPYGEAHVYQSWIDEQKKVGALLCSVGEELVLVEVPLLSASQDKPRAANAMRRPVSAKELAEWSSPSPSPSPSPARPK